MKPVFDTNGLAAVAGQIRVYYFSNDTGEYQGRSDEYINIGVSMPGNSTNIDPGEHSMREVPVFENGEWKIKEDHRGDVVYSISSGDAFTVNYIGPVHDGYTTVAPSGSFDKWDGEKWLTDTDAQHAAAVETANRQKALLLAESQETISFWQTELQLGMISEEDKARLIIWMNYIKAVKAVDTSTAPDISWPKPPAE
ncbi:tail fiber assembly protein [Enterobacteriaceae bacterium RIT814]|nr:tail fiber assembly protein [Enterobacteriaceae bacterium RIT 814]